MNFNVMNESRIISIKEKLAIPMALNILKDGGVIAIPTDTVYGIVCAVFNSEAIERIYTIKGRESNKALPILIGDIKQLNLIAKPLNPQAQKLIKYFWPGALTLILPSQPNLPKQLSPFPTVGVRIPNHAWLINFLLKSGPLASTSANLSGHPEAHSALGVKKQLVGKVDLILNGGISPHSIPSTIVDCSSPEIRVIREGPISSDSINQIFK